jgi:enamine deaminase RidA (YjgF/YER057c/UK114 family)
MLALDASGALVGGDDVVAQAERVHENIKAVLAKAGAGFEDVVKVTVYLRHIDDRAAVNTVRRRFFGESRPASTLVEVSAFVIPGALVEMDAVAHQPESRS